MGTVLPISFHSFFYKLVEPHLANVIYFSPNSNTKCVSNIKEELSWLLKWRAAQRKYT